MVIKGHEEPPLEGTIAVVDPTGEVIEAARREFDPTRIDEDRQQEMPEGSYTASLFKQGTARIAQKVVEEGGEVAIAASTGDTSSLPGEVADLLYHTLVLMAAAGIEPELVWKELRKRRK
ncbi:MAG: phosphoribosyl-ATP diphosphatase [Bacteroidetes bacterium]|nr:phosphoribosyl-ATP diphosphatase [Bacteroidota bacterium]